MEKEKPKPNPLLRICVLFCLPFAYVLKYTLLLLLIVIVFCGSFGLAYEYVRTPNVVRGIPADYTYTENSAVPDGGDLLFTEKLRAKYPDGTKHEDLRRLLKKSGFDSVGQDHAHFSLSSFPCVQEWSVRWQNNQDGTIDGIQGTSSFTCL